MKFNNSESATTITTPVPNVTELLLIQNVFILWTTAKQLKRKDTARNNNLKDFTEQLKHKMVMLRENSI